MPNATVIPFPVQLDAGRSLISSLVADYHTGRGLVDDESACIWTLADLLEESCGWTDIQRRAVAATLQREVLRRVGETGR